MAPEWVEPIKKCVVKKNYDVRVKTTPLFIAIDMGENGDICERRIYAAYNPVQENWYVGLILTENEELIALEGNECLTKRKMYSCIKKLLKQHAERKCA